MEDSEVSFAPEFAKGSWRKFFAGLLLVIGGMAALLLLAVTEAAWLETLPWARALAGPVAGAVPEAAIEGQVRPLPLDNFPTQSQVLEDLEGMELGIEDSALEALGFGRTEALLMAAVSEDDMNGMLLEGRLPEPGKPEVLAGDLCRLDSFRVDNLTFTVTGRLKPGVGALTFTYLLPAHTAWEPLYATADDTVQVWIDPEGRRDPIGTLINAGLLKEEDAEDPGALQRAQDALFVYEGSHLHSMSRTDPQLSRGALFVLVVMLLGTTILHTQLFLLWRPRAPRFLKGLLDQIASDLRGWYAIHFIAYGAFAVAMVLGILQPLANMQMMDFVRAEFSDGDLAYIGEAYLSGNVMAATNATWQNNYLLQTLGLTFLISVPPLALGFFKTLLSLGMVGFVMAPIWTDVIANYTFHSGTMVLELEPYILAGYVVILWPVWFFRGIFVTYDLSARARQWVMLAFQAALLCGALLYVAALYEAVTLIHIAGVGQE